MAHFNGGNHEPRGGMSVFHFFCRCGFNHEAYLKSLFLLDHVGLTTTRIDVTS